MNANMLKNCVHLKDISVADLISQTGLYQPILVNVFSDKIEGIGEQRRLVISSDVKRLYDVLNMQGPLCLPCAICQRELVPCNA